MSVCINKDTKSLTINDMFKQLKSLEKSQDDKIILLTQLIKSNQCDSETFEDLYKDINDDIDKMNIYEKEIIDRNNQTVNFQGEDYKIISLLKLKQTLMLRAEFSEKLVSTISQQENSAFITNSLSEFKKARENRELIDQINKLITQFNNTIKG
jgi:wyosine [tRNA(Phe)-imidazoG37] synthetase (radical SAM superfamily)